MATFKVKGPDGVIHTVNAPEGATQEDAIAFIAASKYNVEPPTNAGQTSTAGNPAVSSSDLPTDLPPPAANAPEQRTIQREPSQSGLGSQAAQEERRGEITGRDRGDYLVGGFNKGILDIVDFPTSMGNMALDATGVDADTFRFFNPSDLGNFRESQTAIPESIARNNTPVMDSLRTGLEWGSGAVIPSSKLAKLPDLFAAGGAMTGEAIGGETGEMIGGLAGAFTPAGVSGLAEGIPLVYRSEEANALRRLAGREEVTAPQDGNVEASMRFIKGTLGDQGYNDMAAALRQGTEEGQLGTSSDLFANPRMAEIENYASRNSTINENLRPPREARLDQSRQMYDDLAPQGIGYDGAPVMPGRVVGDEVAEINNQATRANQETLAETRRVEEAAQAQAESARIQAEGADATLGGTGRVDESSAELSRLYKNFDKALTKFSEKPAWREFDETAQINIAQIKSDLDAFTSNMPAEARADLYAQYNTVLRHLENLPEQADPRSIQYILHSMKGITHQAVVSGDKGPLPAALSRITRMIDNTMRQSDDIGPAFRRGVEASAAKNRALGGDALEKARKVEPELFASTANFSGPQGKVTMRAIEASEQPNIKQAAEQYLRDVFRKEGVTQATLQRYAPALDSFPALRKQLEDAAGTRAAADEATSTVKTTAAEQSRIRAEADKTLQDVVKGSNLELSKFARAPRKYIDEALTAKDPSDDIGTIYTRLSKRNPEAAATFKSEALDLLKDDAIKLDDMTTEQGRAFQRKLDRLMQNGIVTMDDTKAVTDIIARQEGRRLRKSYGSAASMTEDSKFTEDAVATALTLPMLSVLPSSHQLMAAGMLKRNWLRLLRSRRADPVIVKELGRLLKSPERLLQAVDGKLTAESTPAEMNKYFAGVMRVLANEMTDQAQ